MSGPKSETVTVVLTKDSTWPDGIKKEFQSNLGNGSQLTFKNDHHPGFKVDFVISDPDHTGYLFPQDKKQALWAKKIPAGSTECLTTEHHWNGFKAVDVSPDFKTLTVSNPNLKKQLFTFTLRFTLDPQNGDCIDWDPIGDDQNGPRTRLGLGTSTTTAAIGGAAGAGIMLATNEAVTATSVVTGAVVGALAGYVAGLIWEQVAY